MDKLKGQIAKKPKVEDQGKWNRRIKKVRADKYMEVKAIPTSRLARILKLEGIMEDI